MSAGKRLKDRLSGVAVDEPAPVRLVEAIDLGGPVFINAAAGPVEYLVSRGELETEKDERGMGGVRYHTAIRLRELVDGAQLKGMRSPDLLATPGGGFNGNIPAYKLDCMRRLGAMRTAMPNTWVFDLLMSVVWGDEWLDIRDTPGNKRDATRQQRLKTIEILHWALDQVALSVNYLDPEIHRRRWGGAEPKPTRSIRRRILVSRA